MASRAHGHAFEERFLNLTDVQLAVAYRQAQREESLEVERIKTINKAWMERFDILFKNLYMFTNPEAYGHLEEMKQMGVLREEVKAEEFPELWEEMLDFLPEEIIVEEPKEDPFSAVPTVDPEVENFIAGFKSYRSREDGE